MPGRIFWRHSLSNNTPVLGAVKFVPFISAYQL